MKIIANTKLELHGKKLLLKFMKMYKHKYPKFIKNVIFDEARPHSYFDESTNTIILGIKDDWDYNIIVEMFLHESFHCYSHDFCKSNSQLCDVYLRYIRHNYKYRGFEFENFVEAKNSKNDKKKDYDILNNFADHLIVLFNTIKFMTTIMKVDIKIFRSKSELYHKFILYLLKNYKKVEKDLEIFGLNYEF